MAVNFGNTIMEGDIAPSVRVQNPVQDDSGAVLGKALAPAAAAIGEIAGSIWKGQQDDANNKFLTGFENKLLDYATGVEQGELTQREAILMARTEYQQAIASAPALRDDLNKVWSSSFQSAGTLGHVLVSGSEEENLYKKIQEAAITAGYNSVEEYQQNQRLGIYAADVKRQHDVQLAQNGIVTESMKSQGLVAGSAYAQSLFPVVQKTLNDARAQIEANPSQKAEILADVLNRVNSDIALVKSEALGANLEFITSPVEELLKTFENSVMGSTEIATYEANEKLVQFRYETMLKTANPEIAEWAAKSKFLESLGLSENTRVSNFLSEGVLQFLESTVNGDKNANFLSNSADSQAAAVVMNDLLSNVNGSSPEAVTEAKKSIGGLLDGSFVNERAAKDGAMGWKNLVEVLGGSGLASFVEKYGDDIPSEHRAEIAGLLGKYYDSELTNAITQYWDTQIVGTAMVGAPFGTQATPNRMREEKVSNIAQPVWNGNAVEFVPKPGFENDANALAIINDLNVGQNSIGEPLNTLIRAHAFLTKTDPKQVWEQNFAGMIFQIGPDGQPLAAPSAQDVLDPAQEGEAEVDAMVTSAIDNLDNVQAVAAYTGDTSNAALNAINSSFNLADFNIDEGAVESQIMAYAQSNYNPISILPTEGGSFDVLGTLKGTGDPEESHVGHNHGDLDVKFGSGVDTRVSHKVVDTWAKVQQEFGTQLTVVSGFRDPSRNAKAGGAKLSQHMHGNAIDIETGHLSHAERLKLIEIASKAGFTGIGVYNNNLHFDMGGKRAWGPNYRNASVPSWARATINKHLGS